MRYFPILVFFVLAFGGAAVFYEKESRKIKGVHSQITDLQAKVGDLQAEVNRLRSELEASKVSERRRPSLKSIASAGSRSGDRAANTAPATTGRSADGSGKGLVASDVTSSGPAIRREEDEWSRPTVDADRYRSGSEGAAPEGVQDPYQ